MRESLSRRTHPCVLQRARALNPRRRTTTSRKRRASATIASASSGVTMSGMPACPDALARGAGEVRGPFLELRGDAPQQLPGARRAAGPPSARGVARAHGEHGHGDPEGGQMGLRVALAGPDPFGRVVEVDPGGGEELERGSVGELVGGNAQAGVRDGARLHESGRAGAAARDGRSGSGGSGSRSSHDGGPPKPVRTCVREIWNHRGTTFPTPNFAQNQRFTTDCRASDIGAIARQRKGPRTFWFTAPEIRLRYYRCSKKQRPLASTSRLGIGPGSVPKKRTSLGQLGDACEPDLTRRQACLASTTPRRLRFAARGGRPTR